MSLAVAWCPGRDPGCRAGHDSPPDPISSTCLRDPGWSSAPRFMRRHDREVIHLASFLKLS